MDCRQVQYALSDYIEENLSEDTHKVIEAHLRACEVCAQEYHRLLRVGDLLRQWAPEVPTRSLWVGVRGRLGVRHRQRRLWRYTAGAAAAVLLGIAIWAMNRPTPPPPLHDAQAFYKVHEEWSLPLQLSRRITLSEER